MEEVTGEGNKMGQGAPFSADVAHLERWSSEIAERAGEASHR